MAPHSNRHVCFPNHKSTTTSSFALSTSTSPPLGHQSAELVGYPSHYDLVSRTQHCHVIPLLKPSSGQLISQTRFQAIMSIPGKSICHLVLSSLPFSSSKSSNEHVRSATFSLPSHRSVSSSATSSLSYLATLTLR